MSDLYEELRHHFELRNSMVDGRQGFTEWLGRLVVMVREVDPRAANNLSILSRRFSLPLSSTTRKADWELLEQTVHEVLAGLERGQYNASPAPAEEEEGPKNPLPAPADFSKITLPWLFQYVPAHFWFVAGGLLVAVFTGGLWAGGLPIVRDIVHPPNKPSLDAAPKQAPPPKPPTHKAGPGNEG